MSSLLARWCIGLAVFIAATLIFITREEFLFPGAFECLQHTPCLFSLPPAGTREISLPTSDEKQLRVWLGTPKAPLRGHAILFGGDSGRIEHLAPVAEWFQRRGFSTTIFDYRGFGRSTGWPTEGGIYRDTEAVSALARSDSPERTVVFGLSFGACPAAYAATIIKPKMLVIASGYVDFPSVDRNNFWIPLLVDLAWPKFPTGSFVERLTTTDLLLLHGSEDEEIPIGQAGQIESHYRGIGTHAMLIAEGGTHRTTFGILQSHLAERLEREFPL